MQEDLKQITKLNLGCGEEKKEGYINVDFNPLVNPDVPHDLNMIPYPFPDNTFDLVEALHVLEHLDRPLLVMKEIHRIMKPGGKLIIKVPHFSRGFTHAQHRAGFDLMFPHYFDSTFTKSGYFGVEFVHTKTIFRWMAFFHLMKRVGVNKVTIAILKVINAIINFFANLSPRVCSRLWCFWVGGFEEMEFHFICKK